MKIVYYSSIFFTDCDFPLIRQYNQRDIDTLYILAIVSNKTSGGLFNIKSSLPKHGIVRADAISEFLPYRSFIDLEKIYLVNRTSSLFDIHNWLTYLKLCVKIIKFKASILHITQVLGLSEILLYVFRRKMVLSVHDPLPHSGEESSKFENKRKLAFKIIPKLILLNENQKNDFMSCYKPKGKVFFNKLSIYEDLSHLISNIKTHRVFQKYILFFGHISPYKGIDVLCEAMMQVNKVVEDVYCVIAGKGDLYFDFDKFSDNSHICLINRFVEIEELVNLIHGSEFVVCPYKDATQSGVVFSSFALQKPVVASNVGGLPESVIDDLTGKLVPPNNSQKLAEAIIDLLESPDKLSYYSNNIREKYSNGEFSWDHIADVYLNIYQL